MLVSLIFLDFLSSLTSSITPIPLSNLEFCWHGASWQMERYLQLSSNSFPLSMDLQLLRDQGSMKSGIQGKEGWVSQKYTFMTSQDRQQLLTNLLFFQKSQLNLSTLNIILIFESLSVQFPLRFEFRFASIHIASSYHLSRDSNCLEIWRESWSFSEKESYTSILI